MTMNKKGLVGLISILFLLILLPVVVFFMKGRFDIRPRAQLAGAANFKLTPDRTSLSVGDHINVLVSVELTDTNVRVSGVDFKLLYDMNKFNLLSLTPVTGSGFTDTVLLDNGNANYSGEGGKYKYARLSMVSKQANGSLKGGTVALANATLQARQAGSGIIKFPDNNADLQVVGTAL